MLCKFGAVVLLSLVAVVSCQEYVPVPRAGFVRKECVRRVPNGSQIDKLANGDLKVTTPTGSVHFYPPCPYPALPQVSGWWLDAVQSQSGNGFSYMASRFNVPAAPKMIRDAYDYYFPGFENSAGNEIIQPVIQYGKDEEGGGDFWRLASWYVTSTGHYVIGDKIDNLKPGTIIDSLMYFDFAKKSWNIRGTDMQTNKSSIINVGQSSTGSQTLAYLTKEAYRVNTCDQLPSDGKITFTDTVLKDWANNTIRPNFRPEVRIPNCGGRVQVNGTSATMIWNA